MKPLWTAVVALAAAGSAWADDEAPLTLKDREARVLELEARVRALEAQQDDAEALRKLKEASAKEKPQEKDDLPARVSRLEKAQAAPPAAQEGGIQTFFKDGFRFKTADGSFEGHIGGRVMEHLRFVKNRFDSSIPGGTRPNTFTFKENYIQLDGTFFKDFEYKLQANFFPANDNAGPFASLSDTYLGWRPAKELGFRFGQMEVPFSQEEIESTLYIDLVERSVMNRLSPVRDLGIEAFGSFMDGILQYEIGAFNGAMIAGSNNTRNLNDNNDEKEYAGRLRFMPFRHSEASWIKQLRLGVAGTSGSASGPFNAGVVETFPPLSSVETGTVWAAYAPTPLSNRGQRARLGAELSYVYGSFGLRAEYIKMSLDETPAGADSPTEKVDLTGYYVQATFILTGEDKADEGRLVPRHPLNLAAGDFGAFELAARVSAVDAGDLTDSGFIAAGTNDQVTAYTLGLNWWMVRNVRVSFNWVHTVFDEDLVSGTHEIDHEDALLARFQIDF
jgi:phosphate-selective porin OprO and OprP